MDNVILEYLKTRVTFIKLTNDTSNCKDLLELFLLYDSVLLKDAIKLKPDNSINMDRCDNVKPLDEPSNGQTQQPCNVECVLQTLDEPHNDEPHNDEPHNDELHNDEPHNDEPHNDEPHNDEPHNDEPHNDELHNELSNGQTQQPCNVECVLQLLDEPHNKLSNGQTQQPCNVECVLQQPLDEPHNELSNELHNEQTQPCTVHAARANNPFAYLLNRVKPVVPLKPNRPMQSAPGRPVH
jgi:hypothetical protein